MSVKELTSQEVENRGRRGGGEGISGDRTPDAGTQPRPDPRGQVPGLETRSRPELRRPCCASRRTLLRIPADPAPILLLQRGLPGPLRGRPRACSPAQSPPKSARPTRRPHKDPGRRAPGWRHRPPRARQAAPARPFVRGARGGPGAAGGGLAERPASPGPASPPPRPRPPPPTSQAPAPCTYRTRWAVTALPVCGRSTARNRSRMPPPPPGPSTSPAAADQAPGAAQTRTAGEPGRLGLSRPPLPEAAPAPPRGRARARRFRRQAGRRTGTRGLG